MDTTALHHVCAHQASIQKRHFSGENKTRIFSIITLCRFAWTSTAGAAGSDVPTPLTNKAAIALVQSHADYVWTLVAATLVFFMLCLTDSNRLS